MKRAASVLAVGLGWSLLVCLPAREGLSVLAGGIAILIAPYAALAAVSRWVRSGVLGVAVLVVLALNAYIWLGVRSSDSSTAPVALGLGSIVLSLVAPIVLAASWAADRFRATKRAV